MSVAPRSPVPPLVRVAAQRTTHGMGRAFATLDEAWLPLLQRVAALIADGDLMLADDLVQEARILLWELDPSRFERDDLRLAKRMLVRRMRKVARREGVRALREGGAHIKLEEAG